MIDPNYRRQVLLLLDVLPEVAKEECFALHGGTAINLFVRDMPRLSVDIDLTYVPIEDRQTSIARIRDALRRIKSKLERLIATIHINDRTDIGKLLISAKGVDIKVEVNLVNRGTMSTPTPAILCSRAQEEFDAFCEVLIVPTGQLYGGKICAALDRQHPRDVFDVKYLLENEGFSVNVKAGFILALVSSDRPLHELLNPTRLNQKNAFEHHFDGMTVDTFTYEDFELTRDELIHSIHRNLTDDDREFILSIKRLEPNWEIYNVREFPSVQWKLRNIQRLYEVNPSKYASQLNKLEAALARKI